MERQSSAHVSGSPVLAVDTSTPHSSLAITRDGKVLSSILTETKTHHSQTLFVNISNLLRLAGLEIEEIGAFAVATGPGSFTGLRVGLAAVKGLARTTGKPSLGVNSIDVWALSAGVAGLVLVMIDAGRDEIYCGLRQVDGDGMVSAPVGLMDRDMVMTLPAFLHGLAGELKDRSIVIVGDGALRSRDQLEVWARGEGNILNVVSQAIPADESWQLKIDRHEPAVVLGHYADRLLKTGRQPKIHPYYIRPSDAEIKWKSQA